MLTYTERPLFLARLQVEHEPSPGSALILEQRQGELTHHRSLIIAGLYVLIVTGEKEIEVLFLL